MAQQSSAPSDKQWERMAQEIIRKRDLLLFQLRMKWHLLAEMMKNDQAPAAPPRRAAATEASLLQSMQNTPGGMNISVGRAVVAPPPAPSRPLAVRPGGGNGHIRPLHTPEGREDRAQLEAQMAQDIVSQRRSARASSLAGLLLGPRRGQRHHRRSRAGKLAGGAVAGATRRLAGARDQRIGGHGEYEPFPHAGHRAGRRSRPA